jgi:hypothetical protein
VCCAVFYCGVTFVFGTAPLAALPWPVLARHRELKAFVYMWCAALRVSSASFANIPRCTTTTVYSLPLPVPLLPQFLVNNAFGVDWASQVKHPFATGVHTARGRQTRLNSNIAAPQIQVRLRSWFALLVYGVFLRCDGYYERILSHCAGWGVVVVVSVFMEGFAVFYRCFNCFTLYHEAVSISVVMSHRVHKTHNHRSPEASAS